MTSSNAARHLLDELTPLVGPSAPIPPGVDDRSGSLDWAESGAMALTRSPSGIPQLSPGSPASWMRAAAALLDRPDLDGAALLGERMALDPDSAVGGAYRSYRTADGWLGLSLPRPEDIALIPALVERELVTTVHEAIEEWASRQTTAVAEERARLLGLASSEAHLTPAEPSRQGVRLRQGGQSRRRPTPTVVDFSSLWAGPLCANLLGDAGARVVKVESIHRPDGARGGNTDFYDLLHGGHESVALDFQTERGRRGLAALIDWADVVIEASRPHALARLGLDAGRTASAGKIWISITAHGRGEGDRVGFGADVAANAGLTFARGSGPHPVGDAIADPLAGATAATAAHLALASDSGWLIDVSMRDVAAWAGSIDPGTGTGTGNLQPPRARATVLAAPALGAHTDAVLSEAVHQTVGRLRE